MPAAGWHGLTPLKGNRQVNPQGQGKVPLARVEIPEAGPVVHWRGYGFIKVFGTVSKEGAVAHWATSDLDLPPEQREVLAQQAWGLEPYHRGLKQCCGVEKSAARTGEGQGHHILLSLQAFLPLEVHRLPTGVGWYGAKGAIVRDAVRQYLARPSYLLAPTA